MRKSIISLVSVLLCVVVLSGFVMASTMTIRPNSQGSYAQWSNVKCNSGSSEWMCVDEVIADNKDYLYSTAINAGESFNFGDVNLTSSIYGIELFYNSKAYSSSRYYFSPLLRINNIDFNGSRIYCGGSTYALRSQWFEKNPATGSAWTASDINNLEAGMKIFDYTYAGAYISQMYINVDYDAPDAYPDLNVIYLSANEVPGNGNLTNGTLQAYVSATIKNNGLDSAEASITAMEGSLTDYKEISVLRPGMSQSFQWIYDCTEPHNVTITADINNTVTESDETNNAKTVYIDCIA